MVEKNGHDLTSDEPYQPSFGNEADNEFVHRVTRTGSERAPSAPPREKAYEYPPLLGVPEKRNTYADPLTDDFKAKLDELRAKLVSGVALSGEELEIVTQHGAIDLLNAKRPAVRLQALRLLQEQRIRKLASTQPPEGQKSGEPPSVGGLNMP